ncbi:glycosyltransferase family 61 protein [Nodosilinea sp. LEGE 06152]|uniref:glycosyltransferase family 61 protein n=1 Tax=Nodosilinea sp. LEGE 06152 TaxID=2777966 RepID=UPI00188286FD|nr:glycosyltransferase family 61 protein [Nodosilinea sp. LEGE 06152]MBE9158349.1 glycosyltransferase family 61 protein [Nodosilinea sp. LEGE 06152]
MKTLFGQSISAFKPRIVQQWVRKVKRAINYAFGKGPYDLAPFEYIEKLSHQVNLNATGVDYPDSTTGILYQENTGWFEYKKYTNNLDRKLIKKKKSGRDRFLTKGILPEQPRILYSISQGGVIVSRKSGYECIVYDSVSRLAVEEVTYIWEGERRYQYAMMSPRIPGPKYLEGISLNLVTLTGFCFFHFLHQALPQAFFCRQLFDRVDHILVNGSGEIWRQKWLERAGIPLEKVIWMDRENFCHYRCEQLLFTSWVVWDARPTNWSVAAIRDLLDASPSGHGDRWLWASRSDADLRVLAWEDEILKRFPKFEKICFSSLSPEQAIDACRSCSVFAGPHGAAFSNIVFCNPGAQIIEFSPSVTLHPCYIRLSDICGLNHASFVVDFERLPDDFEDVVEDMASLLWPTPKPADGELVYPGLLNP